MASPLFDSLNFELATMVADKAFSALDDGVWYTSQERSDAINAAIQQIVRKGLSERDFDLLLPFIRKSEANRPDAGNLEIILDNTYVGTYEATLNGLKMLVVSGVPRNDFIQQQRPYSHVAVYNDGGIFKAVSPDWLSKNTQVVTLTLLWVSVPRYEVNGSVDIPQCFYDQQKSLILTLAQQYLAQIEVQTV